MTSLYLLRTRISANSTVVRVFAVRTEDRGSIPFRVIPETIKIVIITLCQTLDKREGKIHQWLSN